MLVVMKKPKNYVLMNVNASWGVFQMDAMIFHKAIEILIFLMGWLMLS